MCSNEGSPVDEEIAVWFAGGVPVRLVWGGTRYRVNDVPTPLTAADILWHPMITHPPVADWRGWRFQAVDDHGDAVVFDIREAPVERHWRVVAVYGDEGRHSAVYGDEVPRSAGAHRLRGAV
jgi:hypothetical protein